MSADVVDSRRRRFLTGAVTVVGGVGGLCTAWPFASAWQPSERARAIGAPIEIDISKLEPGAMLTEAWQGKPVWILSRTSEALDSVSAQDGAVRDPDSSEEQQPDYARNRFRSRRPDILVLVGLCTHLGCSPKHVRVEQASYFGLADWRGGFLLSLPWLALRLCRPGVQGRAGADQSRRAPAPVPLGHRAPHR